MQITIPPYGTPRGTQEGMCTLEAMPFKPGHLSTLCVLV